ncbi:RusA family crossover junction endodeoxyribonuclease [Lysobacter enzymogenes]|uniref:RusA family crossover junction endodeoxyribonuclease n=1 Tax=Lysobacter enzymogenes TaxID=69 RepID=UPI00089A1572|nr:RusA family crossover junction endodeoxyribonuclease [Lysobacter enzymogenes]SDW94306.1 crossover junction endodeoxyribonuclease RusA [Lysobacter enzymogenes]
MSSITLVLPYPLSANRYWKAITIPGRTMMAPTKEATAYKREVAFIARHAGIGDVIRGRVAVSIRLYPARPADWAKRARKDPLHWDDTVRCIDLDNARKVLYDALKGIAFEDDKWIRRDEAERCEPDEHGARVVVTIEPLQRAAIAPGLFGEVAA